MNQATEKVMTSMNVERQQPEELHAESRALALQGLTHWCEFAARVAARWAALTAEYAPI